MMSISADWRFQLGTFSLLYIIAIVQMYIGFIGCLRDQIFYAPSMLVIYLIQLWGREKSLKTSFLLKKTLESNNKEKNDILDFLSDGAIIFKVPKKEKQPENGSFIGRSEEYSQSPGPNVGKE